MENIEKDISKHSQVEHKNKKKRYFLYFFIPFFIAGNIGFYLQERAKWIYPEQPYPEAKEWLVPANMMLVYGTILTKLPFIDERSFIMKPIIGLQDYFVSRWQENLPDDDAEKYLGWYIFRFMTYITPRVGIVLYGEDQFSFEETREIENEVWEILQALKKFDAKDKIFKEIRYAAFNNLSALYVVNFSAYWVELRENPFYTLVQKEKEVYFNEEKMFTDDEKFQKLIHLYIDIKYMDKFYLEKYPSIYYRSRKSEASQYWIYSRLHEITVRILRYLAKTKKDVNLENICMNKKSTYLLDYYKSKKWLLENNEFLKTKGIDIKTSLSKKADDAILILCQNINKEFNDGI